MSTAPLEPDRQSLAAEYALGVLEGAELETARALERDDARFRLEVARWAARLTPLFDEVDPVEPPAAVLESIERRTGASGQTRDNVVQLRRKLGLWRVLAGGSTALAASLALVLVLQPSSQPAPPAAVAEGPMVATIEGEGARGVMAMWDERDRSLVVAAAASMAAAPGHSHELWIIPADGKPRSMGVMPPGRVMRMTVQPPMAAFFDEGATLAISLEPANGSPTGLPTGPVVATGTLQSS
jgi:anti-sigma-K factor RskA